MISVRQARLDAERELANGKARTNDAFNRGLGLSGAASKRNLNNFAVSDVEGADKPFPLDEIREKLQGQKKLHQAGE